MGFIQADPIRAPARAQDLILRQRVKNYHAGDLERRYDTLDIEEDFFVIYGFVTKSLHALMHPRSDSRAAADNLPLPWPAANRMRAQLLFEFVSERGEVHPREVDQHFAHGKVENFWGGSSNATTHLLQEMHYRGLLRVVRREKGIRVYATRESGAAVIDADERRERIDALVDVAVKLYAPLPASSLASMVSRLRYAVPQWQRELKTALQRAKDRLMHAQVDEIDWYWAKRIRCVVRFETHPRIGCACWRHSIRWCAIVLASRCCGGWEYRFEAYTPAAKRKLGYYALPLLWRDRVLGWANLSVKDGQLLSEFGYVKSPPGDRAFKRELAEELDRMRAFLALPVHARR